MAHGIAIDSQGNAWVAKIVGNPGRMEKLAFGTVLGPL